MLKLLSRSIRNDSESLAADLTKLQSVSHRTGTLNTRCHKLLPPIPNNILFWAGVVLLVLCFIFWMKGLGNYDGALLLWIGSEGTRGVSPGCGHGTPVLSGTSPLGCRPLVDTLLGSAARGLYNYCIVPVQPIFGALAKPCFMRNTSLLVPSMLILLPPFYDACIACHVILVQPRKFVLVLVLWSGHCDQPHQSSSSRHPGQERCADTPSSGYTLIPGKQGSW